MPFRGPEYTVSAGSEGVASLMLDIPRKACGVVCGPREDFYEREGSKTPPLFFVQCVLSVKLSMGFARYMQHPLPYIIPKYLPIWQS